MRSFTITRPDDWHLHLRDGDYLEHTVKDAARYFGRAIIMPNLNPPVATASDAERYYRQIMDWVPTGKQFEPLMTLYITPDTSPETVRGAAESAVVKAFKLYPAGATTNSDAGVSAIETLYPVFAEMEKLGVVLCIHGEVTNAEIDIFDREAMFIEQSLGPICRQFPNLKIVFEHITTNDAVQFVQSEGPNVAATITAHHLLYNRNDMLAGGMRPIYYCLPVLKRNTHQVALIKAAISGNPKFFLGTDSAPHPRHAKESACGCAAGSYTEHAALELYAEVFDAQGALEKLEGFASFFGPDFYGLPRHEDTITLQEEAWLVPDTLAFGQDELIPIRNGEHIAWRVLA